MKHLHTANAGLAEALVSLRNDRTRHMGLPLTKTAWRLATDISMTEKVGQGEALRLLATAAQPVLSIEA
jgi:hypothetical protein